MIINQDLILANIHLLTTSLIAFTTAHFLRKRQENLKNVLALTAGLLLGISLFDLAPELQLFLNPMLIIAILVSFLLPILINRVRTSDEMHEDRLFIDLITFFSFSFDAVTDGFLLSASFMDLDFGHGTLNGLILHRFPILFSLYLLFETHTDKRRTLLFLSIVILLVTPLSSFISFYFAMEYFSMNSLRIIQTLTVGLFLYLSVYHLIYEHRLYEKKNRVFIFLGLLISLVFIL